MVSVLSTVVNELKNILRAEEKPNGMHNMLVKDIKNGMKIQVKVAQKDFLEICLKKDLYSKDIMSLAKNPSNGEERRFKQKARRILKDRIRTKNE